MNKVIPAILLAVGVPSAFFAGYGSGHAQGQQRGLDIFFESCSTSSGVYVQQSTSRLIVCAPVEAPTEAPAKEGLTSV